MTSHNVENRTAYCHLISIIIFIDVPLHNLQEIDFLCAYTVSHFSYAPLIKFKISRKRNVIFFYFETTNVKRIIFALAIEFLL